ncbi:HlyD family efflux transporter periplasmic adaptor subunit [Pseudomonas sp. C27(2019)]|uniref:HlyD family secretion protein n=1 Tax=Pseudomonas sp. C27(2019) TaxID=2604941 RepID=UPI0012453676|nr:HlyD family efflux transporter periplasmic adaptor subunit [Pseudomonas sp. C27(2019)]QEY60216.1 HlyD family efflux transporter periplasmic adaptor subunit [Pseudomonas sp. C27(2019)]
MSADKGPSRLYIVPLLLALAAAGGFGYWKSLQDRLPEGIYEANGRLEATEVQVATKYPGRLAEVLVAEGDNVLSGQLLARIDTRTLEAQRAQAQSEVVRARENVASVQATVHLRESERRLALQDLTRFRELYARGHSSGQQIDQQQARFDTASAALEAAQAQVQAAQASIATAEAMVAQLTSEIDDSSLRAPMNGIVQLRLAEPGEVLGAGGRVFLLIDPSDQYMNVYLPSAVAGRLAASDQARIVLDALPEQPLPAEVAFVAAKAQFTPKEVETRDERQKLVFRVKLRLTDPAAVPQAKPGMPGSAYVRRDATVEWPELWQ